MGEIFIRPEAGKPLEPTGERLTSGLTGETPIEHWHRYLLARELARGLDVLDIASGEGYGSALMAQTARKVTGVEISVETVAHARSAYVAGNLSFLHGDARKIPLADASVDLVVSFETLEHFQEQDQFLAEVKRVLRPGGAVLLSTPDRDTYSPAGLPPNPHHVLELTAAEFDSLLRRHFAHVSSQGQRVLLGSALLALGAAPAVPQLTFERRGAGHFETSAGMARARFIVSLASDDARHQLPGSVYIDSDRLGYTDGPALEALPAQKAEAERVEQELRAQLEVLAQERDAQLAALAQDRSTQLAALLQERDAQLAALQQERDGGSSGILKAAAELEKVTRRCKSLEDACFRAEEAARVYRGQVETLQQTRAELDQAYRRCETLQDACDRAEEAARLYRDQIGSVQGLNAALASMRASTSWKISAPIRIVGRMLRRS